MGCVVIHHLAGRSRLDALFVDLASLAMFGQLENLFNAPFQTRILRLESLQVTIKVCPHAPHKGVLIDIPIQTTAIQGLWNVVHIPLQGKGVDVHVKKLAWVIEHEILHGRGGLVVKDGDGLAVIHRIMVEDTLVEKAAQEAIQRIAQKDGLVGFWRGVVFRLLVPTLIEIGVVSGVIMSVSAMKLLEFFGTTLFVDTESQVRIGELQDMPGTLYAILGFASISK